MIDNIKLSPNFSLHEFLDSDVSERDDIIKKMQYSPPLGVIDSLGYLSRNTLQKIRDDFSVPIRINSGYRSEKLNERVGGSKNSRHIFGEAADISIPISSFNNPQSLKITDNVKRVTFEIVGKPLRKDVNGSFFIFAHVAMNMDRFDIDQLIHEYGEPGRPAWCHIAASTDRNGRRISVASSSGIVDISLREALEMGT